MKSKKDKAIDELVASCINSALIVKAQEAAGLRRRGSLTGEEIETLVAICVSQGLLEKAKEAARLRGKSLSATEIDTLVHFYIKKRDYEKAYEAAELGASVKTTDNLLYQNLKLLRFYSFLRDKSEIPIENYEKTFKIAQLGVSSKAVDSFIIRCLKELREGEYCDTSRFLKNFPQLIRLGVTSRGIDAVVYALLSKLSFGFGHDNAYEVAVKFDVSTKAINFLVKYYVDMGWIEEARKAAKLAGRKLTSKEIKKLTERLKK